MANVLILGGGFGGVTAAELLADKLDWEHQITLISNKRDFVFYPALVRLAFGKCEPKDVKFDLRQTMPNHRVRFIEADVVRVDTHRRTVKITGDDITGEVKYDYLIFALGRRLATEKVKGLFEFSHNILSLEGSFRFSDALKSFQKGKAIIGCCTDSRLPVPAYETAFALARMLEARGNRNDVDITLVMPDDSESEFGSKEMVDALHKALSDHKIELLESFPIGEVTEGVIQTANNRYLNYDLLMLIPPFYGTSALRDEKVTDKQGFVLVDGKMRVHGVERMYAVGDCVAFSGPKMGHMAVRQAEVAAENVIAELANEDPKAEYNHEVRLVVDEGGSDSVYLHKELWWDDEGEVHQGRFWHWAKRVHNFFWQAKHS